MPPQPGDRVYYFATPPDAVAGIASGLGAAGLLTEAPDRPRRVIVEKPFGYDLASARAINEQLRKVLRRAPDLPHRSLSREGDRPEHHGVPLRQRDLRAGVESPLRRPRADHRRRDRGRGGPRRILRRGRRAARHGQNHLFQLLALTAMEPPISFRADDVRDERVRVLHALHLCSNDEVRRRVVRGQYAAGRSRDQSVAAYRDEPHVSNAPRPKPSSRSSC